MVWSPHQLAIVGIDSSQCQNEVPIWGSQVVSLHSFSMALPPVLSTSPNAGNVSVAILYGVSTLTQRFSMSHQSERLCLCCCLWEILWHFLESSAFQFISTLLWQLSSVLKYCLPAALSPLHWLCNMVVGSLIKWSSPVLDAAWSSKSDNQKPHYTGYLSPRQNFEFIEARWY